MYITRIVLQRVLSGHRVQITPILNFQVKPSRRNYIRCTGAHRITRSNNLCNDKLKNQRYLHCKIAFEESFRTRNRILFFEME